jgi:uncharacterized protein YggL (DUF469 family)
MSAPCPVLGFVVVVVLDESTSEERVQAMIRDLREALEAHGLLMSGGDAGRRLEYVVTGIGVQATDADRDVGLQWGTRWPGDAVITVSELVDLNQAG